MTSADEVIATAVAEACESPLASKRRITEGYSNEVYGASTTHGQEVIVRIHCLVVGSPPLPGRAVGADAGCFRVGGEP